MSATPLDPSVNVYRNQPQGATPNPVMQQPDAIDERFVAAANEVLSGEVDLVRELIGAHQSAGAIIAQKDWASVRKFFSLSEKYADWADYHTPAVGLGIHAWLLDYNRPLRLTQMELEQHPQWKAFGTETGNHPPMRGWLAAPLVDRAGINWGLLQLSDKYEGEFTAADEQHVAQFAHLLSLSLEALWEVRNLRKASVA
jgi:GAF domain-containing protein